MGLDRKPERLRAVADICKRLAVPGAVDRLGTVGAAYVLDCAAHVARAEDPAYGYGAALEALGEEVSAAEADRMIREIFGDGT